MAGKTKIDGTEYTVKKGKTRIAGTAYDVKGGKTLVDGTAYSIRFNGEPFTLQIRNMVGYYDITVYFISNGLEDTTIIYRQSLVDIVVDSGSEIKIESPDIGVILVFADINDQDVPSTEYENGWIVQADDVYNPDGDSVMYIYSF